MCGRVTNMRTTKETIEYMKLRMPGMRNDGATPMWQHPLNVLGVFHEMCDAEIPLNRWPGEFETVEKICLLHDILENGYELNSRGKHARVSQGSLYNAGFSNEVTSALRYLTKSDECKSSAPKGNYELIKYFSMLADCDDKARVVKVLDRIANMREVVGVFSPERLQRYCWESQVLVMGLAQNIMDPWGKWLRNELQKTIDAAKETF